jgi:D-alanyl-D-alanine carboxypeptidase
MVDAADSKSAIERCGGSSPSKGTKEVGRTFSTFLGIKGVTPKAESKSYGKQLIFRQETILAAIIWKTVLFLSFLGLLFSPMANAGPTLLFDAATGEVISYDRAGEPWYPASLTKLMTAYVVFKKIKAGTLRLEQTITVSPLAASQEPSKIGIPAGGTISVDLALQSLLVYSANDMAYVLAEASGGTVHNFVQDMNATALKLGLAATHYVNPNGLFDPRQLTSARDIGVLAAVVSSEFPEYRHYFSQAYVPIGKRKLMNHNSLIREMPDADGMKTGFVCNSGYNLVASATRNGRRLIAVILGAANSQSRSGIARDLLNDGFLQSPSPARPRLAQIADDPLGAIVPADLTTTVCKTKQAPSAIRAYELAGWGISFGNYDSYQKADMALRGRLIGPTGMDAPGDVGIVRMPNKQGYAAMLWNIDQPTSLALCNDYRSQNAPCDVMTPESFAQIAALSVEAAPPEKKLVIQGSDDPKPAKKRRIKKSFH